MLTLTEQNELRKIADEYIRQVVDAIKNKPIERKGQQGNFSAPVNASGKLADSVQSELFASGIRVTALGYIDTLIYGRKPGTMPPVSAIESWMQAKGLGGSPYGIAHNIGRYGSTIWQRWQGQDSGLLSDVDIERQLTELDDWLAEKYGNLVFAELAA